MQIERIGVLGAGNMGNGIAQVGAASGFSVVLYDVANEPLDRARSSIQKSLSRLEGA